MDDDNAAAGPPEEVRAFPRVYTLLSKCIWHTWGLDVVGLPRPGSYGLKVLSVERNMAEASICQEVRSCTLTSSGTAQHAFPWHCCVHLRHCPVPSISCTASIMHQHAYASAYHRYRSAIPSSFQSTTLFLHPRPPPTSSLLPPTPLDCTIHTCTPIKQTPTFNVPRVSATFMASLSTVLRASPELPGKCPML